MKMVGGEFSRYVTAGFAESGGSSIGHNVLTPPSAHLRQPVMRHQIALRDPQVVVVAGTNVGDTKAVARQMDVGRQPRRIDGPRQRQGVERTNGTGRVIVTAGEDEEGGQDEKKQGQRYITPPKPEVTRVICNLPVICAQLCPFF